ncbi:MAG: hypothetical protein BWY47_00419 [Bacteroidetes bacterium ADurb.Bin302]|jgi:hypothetical protein|nr:MAG: hypothetical protein BWY47_00419 [Bacteroidetes bacterium ADurb.Bin302]HPY53595.1 hypothetical protein [Treponemataceae bacterium]
MEIKEITYSLGRTIQIKQYEPMNFHASIKAEVKGGEDLNKAYAELKKIVQEQIAKEMAIWENPQMILRRMQQQGADKYVKDKQDEIPF